MINSISKLKKFQLLETYSINRNFLNWQPIIWTDIENPNIIRGVEIKKILRKNFTIKHSRNELCFCGSGKKHKKYHPEINPENLVGHQYEIINLLQDEILKYPYTVCKKGCSDCCTDNFEISITEFFTILNYLELKCSDKQIENICNIAKFKISSIKNDKNDILLSKCIFLDETTNYCDIYEVRPIICRKYGYYKNTYCDIVRPNKSATSGLIQSSDVDTQTNISLFEHNGKLVYPKLKTIAYWFSRFEDGKFISQRMNDLYLASTNRSISEYIRILTL